MYTIIVLGSFTHVYNYCVGIFYTRTQLLCWDLLHMYIIIVLGSFTHVHNYCVGIFCTENYPDLLREFLSTEQFSLIAKPPVPSTLLNPPN